MRDVFARATGDLADSGTASSVGERMPHAIASTDPAEIGIGATCYPMGVSARTTALLVMTVLAIVGCSREEKKTEASPVSEPSTEPAEAATPEAPDLDRLSPFQGIERDGDRVLVQVDDAVWYELVSIDGATTADLMKTADEEFGRRAWKRMTEDLAMVLRAHGLSPGVKVQLVLRDVASGRESSPPPVTMTRAKREAARAGVLPPHPEEELALEVWRGDLEQLETTLRDEHAYYTRLGVDVPAAIAKARADLGEGPVTTRALGLEIIRVLARLGDGHTRVSGSSRLLLPGKLPLRPLHSPKGIVAARSLEHGDDLFMADYPFLVAIDGEPIETWVEAASVLATDGSWELKRRQSLWRLRYIQQIRTLRGKDTKPPVQLTLSNGKKTRIETVELEYEVAPVEAPDEIGMEIEDGIGYLRISHMFDDVELLDHIDASMQRLEETKALIIDVRGNGGGTRLPLRRIFPYFMRPDAPPVVANVAAYRQPPGTSPDPDALANRFLFPASHERWSPAQRDAIAEVAAKFEPAWPPPADAFSQWHYFVLSRDLNPKAYHYDRPVAILLDGGCFSATDIFLGALKDHTTAIFIGQPSAGGSGRSRKTTLRGSRLVIKVSSMASFRPDGRLYDGVGIEVDYPVVYDVEALLDGGDPERVRATRLLEARAR